MIVFRAIYAAESHDTLEVNFYGKVYVKIHIILQLLLAASNVLWFVVSLIFAI